MVLYILIFKFSERRQEDDSEQNGSKHSLNLSALNFFMNAILLLFHSVVLNYAIDTFLKHET